MKHCIEMYRYQIVFQRVHNSEHLPLGRIMHTEKKNQPILNSMWFGICTVYWNQIEPWFQGIPMENQQNLSSPLYVRASFLSWQPALAADCHCEWRWRQMSRIRDNFGTVLEQLWGSFGTASRRLWSSFGTCCPKDAVPKVLPQNCSKTVPKLSQSCL